MALVLAPVAPAQGDGGVRLEDRIDLIELDRRILAVNGAPGGPVTPVELELEERVLGLESQGLLGVATTTQRLLGYSSRSPVPAELRYRVSERPAGPSGLWVRDRVALAVFKARLVAFGADTGAWLELALSPEEHPIEVFAEENLAGITTSRRAIAFSPDTGRFVEVGLSPREEIEQVSVQDASVSLVTPRRLLVFRAGDNVWTAIRRQNVGD